MVLRISHVKVTCGIEGDAPGIAEFARFTAGPTDDLDQVIVGIEHLDAAVAEFADVLPAVFIDANVVRIAEFAGRSAGTTMAAEQFAIAGVNLDAVITGISDVEIVVRIDAQTFGAIEIVRALA